MGTYRHILLPIDGSAQSEASARAAIALAASHGARVTALHVLPDFSHLGPEESIEGLDETFVRAAERTSQMRGEAFLARIEALATAAGVRFRGKLLRGVPVHLAILDAARECHCDLIAMGSRGAGGDAGLLGSVTARVAIHGTVPVLVNPAITASRVAGKAVPLPARAAIG